MKNPTQLKTTSLKKALVYAFAIAHNGLIQAQVVITSNAAATKARTTLQYVVDIFTGVAYVPCLGALTLLAYRAWAEPNFKLADGKNILIGGIIFGVAGTLATFLST